MHLHIRCTHYSRTISYATFLRNIVHRNYLFSKGVVKVTEHPGEQGCTGSAGSSWKNTTGTSHWMVALPKTAWNLHWNKQVYMCLRVFTYPTGYCCSMLRFVSIRETWLAIDLNPKPFQLLECCTDMVLIPMFFGFYFVWTAMYCMWLVKFLKVSLLDGKIKTVSRWYFAWCFVVPHYWLIFCLTPRIRHCNDRLEQLDRFTSWDLGPL